VTLWKLPETLEDEFDEHWERWLGDADAWAPFFENLEALEGTDLVTILRKLGVVSNRCLEMFPAMRRSSEGRVVPLPGVFTGTDEGISLLAIGFARGEVGQLAVPYARKAEQ
jgi:hypothetical protein